VHILIITQYLEPENFRINDLALELRDSGHDVTVLTGIPNYPAGKIFSGYGFFRRMQQNYNGIRIIRAPLIPRGRGGRLRLFMNYLSFAISASVFGPLRCRGKYDLIFVYEPSPITVGIPALVLKVIKRVPIMFWVLDLWPESLSATGAIRSTRILAWVSKLTQLIYRHCDRILVSSPGFVSRIEAQGVKPEKILYFPNWAEELFLEDESNSIIERNEKLPDGFLIMFAGNIGAAQDFGTILTAAEQLRNYEDIHWVILGDGRRYDWMCKQIQSRELSHVIHMLGHFPLEAMPGFFAKSDVMLVILRKDPIFSITIPGKVQSYLAYGKPIIAALEGEGARVVEEAGAGISCPAENPDALANAVLSIYNTSASDRNVMAQRGRRYYETTFERKLLLTRLESWIHELVLVSDSGSL